MPFQGMAAYDIASQTTLAAVKAKTDTVRGGIWHIPLYPLRGKPVSGAWSLLANALYTKYLSDIFRPTGCALYCPTNATTNEYSYPAISLAAGDWSIEITYVKDTANGILNVLFGATSLGTIDTYAAAAAYDNIAQLDFTVAVDTTAAVRFTAPTKNGAATSYQLLLQSMILWRRA